MGLIRALACVNVEVCMCTQAGGVLIQLLNTSQAGHQWAAFPEIPSQLTAVSCPHQIQSHLNDDEAMISEYSLTHCNLSPRVGVGVDNLWEISQCCKVKKL